MGEDMRVELTIRGDVQRLALQPGDVVIVRLEQEVSMETAEAIRKHCGTFFEGHKVLVLGPGAVIEVMSS